jgi:hypothetical protein
MALASAVSLPAHYNACTADLKGGARLPFPFCNASLLMEQRLDDLISRMTYQEKTAALDTKNPPIPRLGVPSLRSGESTHGVSSGCGAASANSTGCPTSFPGGPGMGASFDRDLWAAIGGVIGREARGLNNQGKSGLYFLDPNINLCRDPRWGRCQEVPSECPFLTGEYMPSESRTHKLLTTRVQPADQEIALGCRYAAALIDATQRSPDEPRYLQAHHSSMLS